LPAIRPGFLIACLARLLGSPSCGTVVTTLVTPPHALRLRGRRHDAGEHHDGGQDTKVPPKAHSSSHAILLLMQQIVR
jgi:hypothetical protein